MYERILNLLSPRPDYSAERDFFGCIHDLFGHEMVQSMGRFVQHSDIDCLQHSLYVSYNSFLVCRSLGLDYRSAARGALLHDFFLYDWHLPKPYKGLHGFIHPRVALKNARKFFILNELEQEIIQKHMWPLTIKPPKSKEAFVVLIADKYCACMETFSRRARFKVRRIQSMLSC